jgi:Holliday junction resolvase RusA-like endonuclease
VLSIDFRVTRPARTREEYPTRGDLDNLIKAVKDALNGVAWDDDRHVRRYGEMGKEWADSRGAGCRIVVEAALMALAGGVHV